jgi:hypothetical protein
MPKELEPGVRRALSAHFIYLDDLLARALAASGVATESRAFYRYEMDLSGAQSAAIAEGIARVWKLLSVFGEQWGLDLPAAPMLSSHALNVDLQFLDIALDETSPRTLSGYGSLNDDFSRAYREFQVALRDEIRSMSSVLKREEGRDE